MSYLLTMVVEVLGLSVPLVVEALVVVGEVHPIHISAKFLTSQVALTTTIYLREVLLPN
jgi:hypothetical protein